MEKDYFNGEERNDHIHSYDAIVIGSGYGGSAAACRLSMAGLKVCLLEKGKRWEAQDFPTNTFQMISAARMENTNLNFNFGPKDALYQIYTQGDSVAAMACGLGGGSLVNAGVMMPTPLRARRHPRWPNDWEREWESCEASALEMLNVQRVPIKFKNSEVMDKVASDEGLGLMDQNPVNLSVNFDIEDQASQHKKKMDSCQACGNCLSGCPYNAKNSVDKTYLASAIQAKCVVRTECEVQHIVRVLDDTRKNRRWLVYLNDFDYIQSDFVILSAGVFGTAKILFQSQMRGLMVSQKLGSGLSCNGNNVAYLARSKAPLNASGLERNKLLDTPFQERPGPSISSSYISSSGNFTIQSAVIPTSFPVLLFKGIVTYGWPTGYWFLHGIIHKLMHLFNQKSNDMILNVMGCDDSNGNLTFKKETSEILFHPPSDPLLPRKIETLQKLAKKLGGILFMSRYRSTSVHHLGGCCVSSDASSGVCNHNGQVFDTKDSPSSSSVHPGLYVCDASLIPCSVGINPSLTIATASEYVSKGVVKEALAFRSKVVNSPQQLENKKESRSPPVVFFRETLKGHLGGLPCTAYLKVKLNPRTFDSRIAEMGKSSSFLTGKVSGYVNCKAVEMEKMHVVDGEIDLCQVDQKTPYTQYMHYRLNLATSSGSRYLLEGKKTMNPFFLTLNAWKESTTLHMELRNLTNDASSEPQMSLKGNLHISFSSLLATVLSIRGHKKLKFLSSFLQSLFRTYISQMPRESHEAFFTASDLHTCSYPSDTLHEIKTGDGVRISCRQWKSNSVGKKPFPVLLINGYATESYCLPTQKTDLVRTFLQEGHETWILQSRLHPTSASSNNMSIEDIGRFDIPAAISKIIELNGTSTKIHIVAHCVGGLAIHIALMGGHVTCKRIASLSCTNSSMFFKLTAWSKAKLWLPLISISMAILGKDNLLLFQTEKPSVRQRILKSIARAIPRYERCTCYECEVFSGIFGNAFWHQNISHKMHSWINKESLPCLPMAAFPHLRRICNAEFIVDSAGKNSYLIHPERMAISTLYLSGGRTILVTPQTTFLANKFMKLHQPGFRHERVVVDGFGHSDLLIGEESPEKVFPHILAHVAKTEKGGAILEKKRYSKDALSWGEDPYEEEMEKGFFSTVTISALFCFSIFVLLVFSFLTL